MVLDPARRSRAAALRAMSRSLAIALGLLSLVSAAPAAAQSVTALEPEQLRSRFEQWGYRPGAFIREGQVLVFSAELDSIRTLFAMGNCTDGRNCDYVSLVALYNDVRNPPPAWLNEQNNNFDFVTATSDEGVLSLRATVLLGRDGIPE